MKKYEILMDEENTIRWEGHILHRIRALKDFRDIRKGDIGGYVEKECNLSHKGKCWIYDNAKAMDDSRVNSNSRMYDNSIICDNGRMHDNSEMHGDSRLYDNSIMYGESKMYGNSVMCNNSVMHNNSEMYDNSVMYGDSRMYNDSELNKRARLYGKLVSKADDFIEINNPQGRLVTCVKKDNTILYNVGCQNEITEEVFKDRIENENGGLKRNPHREYYYKIIEMAKLCFGVK